MSNDLPYDPEQVPVGPRRRLLQRTPAGSSVLDVGCWSGFAGRFLRDSLGTEVEGVEPDPAMARRAERDYRAVYCMPIERAAEQLIAARRDYQVLLFLDVLEHLAAPGDVLRRARSLVTRDGVALVSLPNIAHWSMRKELLFGRWRYADSGLLDRTHLRFFTLASARELMVNAGWRITHEDSAITAPPPLRALPQERIALLRHWPELFAVQLLFELRVA
ncbi:MAG: class I SAM-dependent methyltransferase [Thermoleophilia bacterium]